MSSQPRSVKTLGNLIRQIPGSREVRDIFMELAGERNDRALAVTVAAILDGVLERAIRRRFRALKSSEAKRIFEGTGPLATFSAKTDIAYAMDLIPVEVKSDLDCIREIRNAFAHASVPITFETDEVKMVCERLRVVKHLEATMEGLGPNVTANFMPRGRFLLTGTVLGLNMNGSKIRRVTFEITDPKGLLPPELNGTSPEKSQ